MKRFSRIVALALALCLAFGSFAFAAPTVSRSTNAQPSQVQIYIKPDVMVTYDGSILQFRDANGKVVYPINYGGTTYLPVRAISGLMKKPIEWRAEEKLVLIGYTISNLDGVYTEASSPYVVTVNTRVSGTQSTDTAWLKPDVYILYNFEQQTFRDANGKVVYPIIYNGTTYLPLRAIAGLMGADITWTDKTKTVSITTKKAAVREETKKLQTFYTGLEKLYTDATAKLLDVGSSDKAVVKAAASASTVYSNMAKAKVESIPSLKKGSLNTSERAALTKLTSLAESLQQYTALVENMIYLAAQGEDYTILGETFFAQATATQALLEEAKSAVTAL